MRVRESERERERQRPVHEVALHLKVEGALLDGRAGPSWQILLQVENTIRGTEGFWWKTRFEALRVSGGYLGAARGDQSPLRLLLDVQISAPSFRSIQ